MPYSVKSFFEINEDMVQILLMLEVLFLQDSKVEDLFSGASSGYEPSLFFSNYFLSLGFKPIQGDFKHDFARMTDEAAGFPLPLATFAKCENIICLAQKILIWRNQVAKKNIGSEALQVSETIWTVIKLGYYILHLCQIG